MTKTSESPATDVLSLDPKAFSVDELRQVIFGDSDRLPKVVALSLLRRKDYPEKEKVADLERVLQNERESPRIRHSAALELGRVASSEAVSALRRGLETKNEFVRRGVVGLLSAHAADPASGAVSPAVLRTAGPEGGWPEGPAAMLRAHAAGAAGAAVRFPGTADFLAPQNPVEARFQKANAEVVNRALRHADLSQLRLPLVAESALAVRCGDQELLYLPTQEIADRAAPQRFLKKNAVAGVVAVHHTAEMDVWSPRYFVITQPSDRDKQLHILLVTANGAVAYAGAASVDGERATFTLRSVKHPGVVAGEIEGVYEAGTVTLKKIAFEQRTAQKLVPTVRQRTPRPR